MVKKVVKPKVTVAHSKLPSVLGYIGGIITVLFSIWSLFLLRGRYDQTVLILSLVGLVCGGLIIYGTVLLKLEHKFKMGSLILIIASIVAILPGGIIGPLISLAGGILTHVRKMI